MRILVAECKQEVSTFNPHLSGIQDFAIRRGQEIFEYHRNVRNEVGGALSIFDKNSDIEVVPTYSAFFITSGGALADSAWQQISTDFLNSIRGAVKPDGVYFCMHGAMATQTEWDPEGYLLEEARKILGEEVPIVVSLDLHGILTQRMLQHSDAIVSYHTYPHVDFFETGERAALLLLKIMKGRVRPITVQIPIPALVRGDELITATGLFGECIRMAQQVENSEKGLSAGMFIGNPFTDVPELQSCSYVVTDAAADVAENEAIRIAETFWRHHERMTRPLLSLNEMVQNMTRPSAKGTVAIIDSADATSSGASGDSNAILRALCESNFQGSLLCPIVDALAVETAFLAGVGSRIQCTLGGRVDPQRYKPLPIEATVKLLSDGRFQSESFGEEWYSGRTAVLECGRHVVVVSSRAVNLYDRSYFFAHGQNPRHFDAVVVKSPHCQKHMYADWCSQMLHVDAPGSSSANLISLGHQRCRRPIFPLDPDVDFLPVPKHFQRPRFIK